ncbi:extracellular solute-binding protein [Paenibacillus sp. 5J-6]|uniref:Extracellular solute-binding protein n=1 Tax=Paenibacillus silvestris TaxID=2606219 RepID=A0A6L8V8K7_9BACL|nr:extracellular solute-binding protein [Paenibacillus silvestris]MZQ86678.1 extracellular solute-binding protein [Paenibacillus silvestris]
MKGHDLKVIMVSLIVLPNLVGCSTENKTQFPSLTTVLTEEQPFQINMSLDFAGKEVPQASNEVQQTIELYTNTKLQITYNQASDYNSKLPAMIASGQLPMVIAGDPRQSYILSAIQEGDFWNLTDYIDDYRNLSTLNPLIYDNVKVDGKLYGLPRTRPISRNTVFYRKDWIEALGLKPPATMDDYYQMLKAFTADDPDKNGKDDTYGVSYMMTAGQFIPDFGVTFGSPNNWRLEEGTFTRMEETPEYMESLNFTKKLYDENLMNHDFATVERTKFEGDFENGKAGAIGNTTNTALAYQSRVQSHSPMSLMDMTGPLAGPAGLRVAGDRGSNGMIMFPKSSVKTEDDLKKLLTFFDKLADNEMADLLEWGIQGKHYELKEGKPLRTNQDQYENQVAFPYKWVMRVVPTDDLKTPGDIDPITKRQLEVEDMNGTYAVPDPTITLFSRTWTEKGNELQQILNDAKVKYVMGKLDETGFKSAIEIAKKHGLDQAAREYAEAFANSQNKDNE